MIIYLFFTLRKLHLNVWITLRKLGLLLIIISFVSISSQEIPKKQPISKKALLEERNTNLLLGVAWAFLGSFWLYEYGYENFVYIPKLRSQMNRNEDITLFFIGLNNSNPTINQMNSSNFGVLGMYLANHSINGKINSIESDNDIHIGWGIISILWIVTHVRGYNRISEELKKRETVSYEPRFQLMRKQDVVELKWTISF